MTTPHALQQALATLDPPAGLAAAVERLTNRYHGSGDYAEVFRDPLAIPAYLHARMPATAAAVAASLARLPPLGPTSLLDLGSGCGAALWAACERWPDLTTITAVERATAFARAGADLWDGPAVQWVEADLRRLPELPVHDVVIASYALNELAEAELDAVLGRAWALAGKALILVEPGMPRGFAVIDRARALLTGLGGTIAAPCATAGPCPLAAAGDFCRFAVRLPRSRIHRFLKGTRGFEDEPYSFLAVIRQPVTTPPRIVRPPHEAGDGVHLDLCTADGLEARLIPRRDPAWKAARKLAWGDALD